MEGLISLGVALVTRVEWPWIALTAHSGWSPPVLHRSLSKQWLSSMLGTHFKWILWSALVPDAAVHPGVLGAPVWRLWSTTYMLPYEDKKSSDSEWVSLLVLDVMLHPFKWVISFSFSLLKLLQKKGKKWIRKLNFHGWYPPLWLDVGQCVLDWHIKIVFLWIKGKTHWKQRRGELRAQSYVLMPPP